MASVLSPGQSLTPGQSLHSNNGRFEFILQRDGNLVLYRTSNGFPLWASGTNGRDVRVCAMQTDGNLVIYSNGGRALWSSGTHRHPGSFLAVQDDANVVIYKPHHAVWATGTNE